MKKAIKGVQLTIRSQHVTGTAEKAMSVLAAQSIAVLGSRSYSYKETTVVLIVCASASKAQQALEAAGFSCSTTSVVLVAMRGMLPRVTLTTEMIRAGITVIYTYSLTTPEQYSIVVYKTTDDEAALRAIEENPQLEIGHFEETTVHGFN